jgi:outer membrane biosynthesis protein TonB
VRRLRRLRRLRRHVLPRRRTGPVVTVVAVLVLAGCGGDSASTPAEAVPELGQTLGEVDDALADRRFRQARRHLHALVATTVEARDAGALEAAEADRILAAVARLLSELPEPRPAPPEEEPEEPAEEPDEPDEEPDHDEELEKKREELEKKLEEERKKLEEELKKQQKKEEKDEKD